jgi:hypothetical protein
MQGGRLSTVIPAEMLKRLRTSQRRSQRKRIQPTTVINVEEDYRYFDENIETFLSSIDADEYKKNEDIAQLKTVGKMVQSINFKQLFPTLYLLNPILLLLILHFHYLGSM